MDKFDKQKKDVLARIDKSVKGSVDKEIKPLVELINSLPDYFTTSSCSGRILLIEISPSGRKDEANWLFLKHSKVNFKEIKKGLEKISSKQVWLRQESMIIHICCRELEAAKKMLLLCHDGGLKRAGIIAIGKKKIMVEAFGTDRLDTVVALGGKVVVDDNYLKILVREANLKMEQNSIKIGKLYQKIKDIKK